MSDPTKKLLIAASGTGGHLFPALAVAEQLTDYQIAWLGVPDRLEKQLVPAQYPLHLVSVEGFQKRPGFGTLKILLKFLAATLQTRKLLQQGNFQGVFTTGGYIAAPAIIAARSLGLPAILHESNALPGKVTRWLSPWCTTVALGFEAAATYLPRAQTISVGTPVRSQFLAAAAEPVPLPDLPIPAEVPLITIVGGSQGAVAVNKLVRQAAPAWLEAGAWVFHQTGDNDPEIHSLQHERYIARPFYDHIAALFRRSTLVIGRAGAGTLTELAMTGSASILIPYPFAAEDHQAYNAAVFAKAGAALVFRQAELSAERLQTEVLHLLKTPATLAQMSDAARSLAVPDSAVQLAQLIRQQIKPSS